MLQVFKSFSDSQTSLKEFVFALKSIVGTEVFVEAVGVGKGKHDLTGFVTDQSKPNQALTVHSDLPTGKDCSLLGSEDIIKFLPGDFRRQDQMIFSGKLSGPVCLQKGGTQSSQRMSAQLKIALYFLCLV